MGSVLTSPIQTVFQTVKTLQTEDALIRLPIVIEVTGLSKSSIRRRVLDGKFPAPLRFGIKCTRWRAGDVTDWLRAQAGAA